MRIEQLDRVEVRQLSAATSRAVRSRRLDNFSRWPQARLPRSPLHDELLDLCALPDASGGVWVRRGAMRSGWSIAPPVIPQSHGVPYHGRRNNH